MNDEQIQHMADRFLGWKLPKDFNPDCGINFDPIYNLGTEYQGRHEPTGTNLFDATQAKAMVRHMVEGLPFLSNPDLEGLVERLRKYRGGDCSYRALMDEAIDALATIEDERGQIVGMLRNAPHNARQFFADDPAMLAVVESQATALRMYADAIERGEHRVQKSSGPSSHRRETPFERSRHLRYVPPLEGPDSSTRRHWIIVRDPGCVPQKKGPFKQGEVDDFIRELIECRPPDTDITVVSLTWDFDVWVECGRERLAIDARMSAPKPHNGCLPGCPATGGWRDPDCTCPDAEWHLTESQKS